MIVGNDLITLPVWVPEYLIRDEFLDNHPAGTVNNTAATPGPGTRTVGGADISVGSGTITNGGTAFWNNKYLRYGGQSRSTGLFFYCKHFFTNQNDAFICAWATNSTPTTSAAKFGFYQRAAANFDIWTGSGLIVYASGLPTSAWHELGIIVRESGLILLHKVAGAWIVAWVDSSETTATVYPVVLWNQSGTQADSSRCIALPAPFDTDDGIATDVLSGSVAAGTTFSHEADCLIEFTVDTLPSSAGVELHFRKQDSDNLWDIYIDNAGTLYLFEAVAGGYTGRGTVGSAVSNGTRVVVIADEESIKIYTNNVLRINYSNAANFKNATTGYVYLLGTGSAISDLKTWPRTLSGRAKQILDIASQ